MDAPEWTMLVTLSVLWGGSFFFVGVAVNSLPPFTLAALRVASAAIMLHAVILTVGIRMPSVPRIWGAFFAMGFLNNVVPFSLIIWGQSYIASGLAAILNATTPLFSAVVAHYFTNDEKMTKAKVIGIATGIAGVIVIIGPDASLSISKNVVAQLSILGAALSYALAAVYGRRFQRMAILPHVSATGQVTASSTMLLPLALIVDRPWTLPIPGMGIWAAVLGLGVLSTAVAYLIYFRLLASSGATNILLVTFLVPVSATLLGVAILGEELKLQHFIGMLFIALGLATIDGRLPRRLLDHLIKDRSKRK